MLLSSDLVSDAAVIVQDEGTVNAKLVGFITLRTDHILNHNHARNLPAAENIEDLLYSFLQANLPTYMVPAVRIISSMPLNTNKEVDRQALAKMT